MLDALAGAYEQRPGLVRELFDELLSESCHPDEADNVADAVVTYLRRTGWVRDSESPPGQPRREAKAN